ncbi:translation initiation factor IF-2 [Chrysiogenes arsenatis]|uniref:translation initiation factor IF-2 n=1 Tax=Chrysiogenes arsenatis TaxID=309797 RepID=UPI000489879D|nr:translation initiation factor IF-2 [Chrysiogenes arsenatis]
MAKLRVHELAKELGTSSKEIMQGLQDIGVDVSSALATVEAGDAAKLKQKQSSPGKTRAAGHTEAAPKTAQTAPEPQAAEQTTPKSSPKPAAPAEQSANPQEQRIAKDELPAPRPAVGDGQEPQRPRREFTPNSQTSDGATRPQGDRPAPGQQPRRRPTREFSFTRDGEARPVRSDAPQPRPAGEPRPAGGADRTDRPRLERRPVDADRPDRPRLERKDPSAAPAGDRPDRPRLDRERPKLDRSGRPGIGMGGGGGGQGGQGQRPPFGGGGGGQFQDKDAPRQDNRQRTMRPKPTDDSAVPAPELDVANRKKDKIKDKQKFIKKEDATGPKATAKKPETSDAIPKKIRTAGGWKIDAYDIERVGGGKKRKRREGRNLKNVSTIESNKQVKIIVHEAISVADFAKAVSKKATEIVAKLVGYGVMANINQVIDAETAELLASEYGAIIEVRKLDHEHLLDVLEDNETNLIQRPPVVTIMGHVDHGKTSLLDKIRSSGVADREAGGITQHIGAYNVDVGDGRRIAFLDTPGHEAFTQMRARGAKVTDIVILVVAADDGVMPQTREAIAHSKAAGVPIIVAVNKIDKPDAKPERVKQELAEFELLSEDWGGTTIFSHVSAKTGEGIPELLEMVLLQADVLELQANPEREARGTVIESRLDKRRGAVSTILVQNGTLRKGDILVAGTCYGRVRAMFDEHGKAIIEAGPSTPVEVLGLTGVPDAGDMAAVVSDEKIARQICSSREDKSKAATIASKSKMTLDDLFTQIQDGEAKELGVIIKADVHGSAEALASSLEKLSTPKIKLVVLHKGAGGITETDINLASASNAIVIGFNVRPEPKAQDLAQRDGVEVKTYSIIYEVVDDIKKAMEGMLDKKIVEKITGHVEVRETFRVPKLGTIAGGYVTDGDVNRNSHVRLVRDNIVVYTGKLASLKRFKDDVKEVRTNYECGLGLEKFDDIQVGDILEVFILEEIVQKLNGE